MHACTHWDTHACTHVDTHTCTHWDTHACTHVYTHTCTHSYVHTNTHRNKRSIAVSLKSSQGVAVVQKLCASADVLIEPYRPGVMEKLGLGPDHLHSLNPGLVYARLTGFGQTGALSHRAGHDINYLATAGVLSVSYLIYSYYLISLKIMIFLIF